MKQRAPRSLVSGGLLARNTLLNVVGKAIPLLIGIVTIPIAVRGMGPDRFGLLSLAWVILNYFTIFDLGLGRATTRYVAEAIGNGRYDQVSRLVWTAAVVQGCLGLVGTVTLAATVPLLVDHLLSIPLELMQEARSILYSMAIAIPIVLCTGSFMGALQAAQRFDLVNLATVVLGSLNFVVPALGVAFGLRLPAIMNMILLGKGIILVATIGVTFLAIPETRAFSFSTGLFSRLFSFGKWVTLSNILAPVIMYIDRFLITALAPISALTYYSPPYDALTRLWLIPSSLTAVLFPVFSSMDRNSNGKTIRLYLDRYMKYVLFALGPIVIVLIVFAPQLLELWLGPEFSIRSSTVLRILSIGVLISSLAQFPVSLLQGNGRPDIVAKLYLVELPFSVVASWLLIKTWGISGAAVAWTGRVALDALLLFGVSARMYDLPISIYMTKSLRRTYIMLFLLFVATHLLGSMMYQKNVFVVSALIAACFVISGWASWRSILDASDRDMILEMAKLW